MSGEIVLGKCPRGNVRRGCRPMDTVPEWHKRNLVTLVDGPAIAGVLSVPRFLEVMDTWAQFITGSLDPRNGVVQE